MANFRKRRLRSIGLIVLALVTLLGYQLAANQSAPVAETNVEQTEQLGKIYSEAVRKLEEIPTKGRAPKTDYARSQFGDGWARVGSCDVRNIILNRDLTSPVVDSDCKVMSGELNDPYTGIIIKFNRGPSTSDDVQIDHVVALSDAWQKGAQGLNFERRVEFSNDPLNLLAVDGAANQAKSNSDAASWLPENKSFRCQYVARQTDVKSKYNLWMTAAEKQTIERVLSSCV